MTDSTRSVAMILYDAGRRVGATAERIDGQGKKALRDQSLAEQIYPPQC